MTDHDRTVPSTPDGGEYVEPPENLMRTSFGYQYKAQSIEQFHDQAMATALNVPCAYVGDGPDDWCPSNVKYEGRYCPVHEPSKGTVA